MREPYCNHDAPAIQAVGGEHAVEIVCECGADIAQVLADVARWTRIKTTRDVRDRYRGRLDAAHAAANDAFRFGQRAPIPADPDDDDSVVYTITVGQAHALAGRRLSLDELGRLGKAIDYSSIPEALATIIDSLEDR